MARTKKKAAPDLSHIHPELRRFARPIAKLVLDPLNAREHGTENLSAIEASLRDHGQMRAAVVTRAPMQLHDGGGVAPIGTIIIGNGMTEAALRLGWTYLAAIDFDGTEAEARKLALRDNRTSDLAGWHPERLLADLRGLQAINVPPMDLGWAAEAIRDLEALAPKHGNGTNNDPGGSPPDRASLVERFLVPPFSVLDARQGYWQDRKRLWIGLGIQSELGRGGDIVPNGTTRPVEQDGCYMRTARKANAIPGGGASAVGSREAEREREREREREQPASRIRTSSTPSGRGSASPGGSPRPAMKLRNGKTVRGDGRGKELDRG